MSGDGGPVTSGQATMVWLGPLMSAVTLTAVGIFLTTQGQTTAGPLVILFGLAMGVLGLVLRRRTTPRDDRWG